MKLFDTLETLEWAQMHFGSLHTNSVCTRRDVMVAVNARLAKGIGLCEVCDDDGFIIENRSPREGFVLTKVGKSYLKRLRANLKKDGYPQSMNSNQPKEDR